MCVDYDDANWILKISNAPLVDGSVPSFRLADDNSVPFPVSSRMGIELEECSELFFGPYSELVGVLLRLSNKVRSDISFSVGKLARCCADSKILHWVAAKRALTC